MAIPVSSLNNRQSIRQLLLEALTNNTLLLELYTVETQIPGEPLLTNVRVVSIGAEYVQLEQLGSFARTIYVALDKIVAFEI